MRTGVRSDTIIMPARNISRRGLLNGKRFFDNSLDAFNPEFWANTSLAILEENMIMANLVNRDFENTLQSYGDIVNTRKPREFVAKRKTNADPVTIQDAAATNIPVRLDQMWHVSYLIKDGEESISMTSIIDEFLRPAVVAEARAIDLVLIGEFVNFLPNVVGGFGSFDSSNAKDRVLDTRRLMNTNKAWVNDRNLVLSTGTETELLRVEQFTDANRVGDDGTALREASLGRKLGFDLFMDQNMPSILPQSVGTGGNQLTAGAVNHSGGYPAGTTVLVVDGFSGALTTGSWITVAGDDRPLQISAHTETTGATTGITLSAPLSAAVADNAVINTVNPGTVSGTYSVDSTGLGYAKEITLSTLGFAPQVGQMVSFGSPAVTYMIVDVNGLVGITLDRPISVAIANNDKAFFGPPGDINFAFHPNAISMVSRPLASPRPGTGALSQVVNFNGLSIRVTITYNGTLQGHLVTIDMLMGKKQLELNLGAVLVA